MANLTNTAFVSRRAIQFGVLALVLLIVGRLFLGYSYRVYKRLVPDPPPPPTYGFGILPQIEFPQSKAVKPTSYALQTPDGSLPAASTQIPVYRVETSRPNLLALDRAKQQAAGLGFVQEPIRLSDTYYRWSESGGGQSGIVFPQVLLMHIYEDTFELTVNWSVDSSYLLNQVLPSQEKAITDVQRYLGRIGLVPDDIPQTGWQASYLKWSGGDYVETVSLSEADFLRVDAFRSPLEDRYNLVTADPGMGTISAVVGKASNTAGIVKLHYQYFPIDYDAPETYPVKPASLAWQELQSGNGYIARYIGSGDDAVVRRVELAYFDAYQPQPFLQPVWVFTGDDGLVAYVPALMPLAQ